MNEVTFNMVNKTMKCHVLPTLAKVITMTTALDLWISHGRFVTFALVMNYINNNWEPCHIMIGIFKFHGASRATIWLYN
jgi:hypothetical protein